MRHPNWDLRLRRWAKEMLGKEYKWGKTDCASLVVDGVNTMYEDDVLPLQTYKDRQEAMRTLSTIGNVHDEFLDVGGEIQRSYVTCGDVFVGESLSDEIFLALVLRNELITSHENSGVFRVSMRQFNSNGKFYRIDNGR